MLCLFEMTGVVNRASLAIVKLHERRIKIKAGDTVREKSVGGNHPESETRLTVAIFDKRANLICNLTTKISLSLEKGTYSYQDLTGN